jgi:hypothetical protein
VAGFTTEPSTTDQTNTHVVNEPLANIMDPESIDIDPKILDIIDPIDPSNPCPDLTWQEKLKLLKEYIKIEIETHLSNHKKAYIVTSVATAGIILTILATKYCKKKPHEK